MHYFFTHKAQTFNPQNLSPLMKSMAITIPAKSRFAVLSSEEKPANIMALLSTLVMLLHLWMLIWLFHPRNETITDAKALMMSVQMISTAAAKPSLMPLQQFLKPEPVNTPAKLVPKKLPPLVRKTADSELASRHAATQSAAQTTSSAQTSAAVNGNATTAATETFVEANFQANYASNPKPDYPSVAKIREWQGKVLLRVQVSADGYSDSVRIEKSSGHDILDNSAAEAVKKWLFIPAKRGDTAIASSVIVPITFSLFD